MSLEQYQPVLLGLTLVLITVAVQSLVAAFVKAKQPGAIPGKEPQAMDHHNFVFRAHRTFHNSLENLPLVLGGSIVCILIAAPPKITAMLVWIYAAARIGHMALYYIIATEQNPSPRSYFYLIGLLATLGLLGLPLSVAF